MNWTLRKKLILGFLTVCGGLAIVAVVGYQSLNSVVSEYKKVAEISLVNVGHVAGMRARSRQTYTDTLKLTLFYDNQKLSEQAITDIKKAKSRYDEISKEYRSVPFIEGEEAVYSKVSEGWLKVKAQVESILTIYASSDANKMEQIKKIIETELDPSQVQLQSDLLALDDFHVETGNLWAKQASEIANQAEKFLVITSILIFALAIGIAIFLSESISRKINQLANRLNKGSDEVAKASTTVSQASTELSSSTHEQASAMQQTVAATNEISAMIQKTADNAVQTMNKAQSTQDASERGKHAVQNVLQAISEIAKSTSDMSEQVKASNVEISEIVKLIKNIGDKTKVINDIVFQTKLLSFNASVEAARAGEMGKGFAVVAEEVGNLATMSGQAAKDISTMLDESISKAEQIVSSTQSSVNELVKSGEQKIIRGREVAATCDVALNEIVSLVEDMNKMVVEISTASKEQANGMNEINKAMNQIDAVTNQNADASQSCSTASEQLMAQAHDSREIVSELIALVQGAKANGAAAIDAHENVGHKKHMQASLEKNAA